MQLSRPNRLLISAALRIKFVCWRQERLQIVFPPQWLELIQQCKELTISVYLPPALAHRGRLARFALICVNSFGHRLKCVKVDPMKREITKRKHYERKHNEDPYD